MYCARLRISRLTKGYRNEKHYYNTNIDDFTDESV